MTLEISGSRGRQAVPSRTGGRTHFCAKMSQTEIAIHDNLSYFVKTFQRLNDTANLST